jgi:hypothetical protein
MNTKLRFAYGIIASALLAVGLERMAGQFDPISDGIAAIDSGPSGIAPDTNTDCWQEASAT